MSLQPPMRPVPGAGAGRKQMPLKPGHSLMDWIKLKKKQGSKLAGNDAPRNGKVTPEMLAQHAGPDGDVWMAVQGYVYNVSPYLDFHPGGREELLRGAGQDATALFQEYHPWVNFKNMIDACYVGRLVPSTTRSRAPATGNSLLPPPTPSSLLPMPPPLTTKPATLQPPRTDFYESISTVSWTIYAKGVTQHDITTNVTDTTCQVSISHLDWVWEALYQLRNAIQPKSIELQCKPRCVVMSLNKSVRDQQWGGWGKLVWQNFKVLEQPLSLTAWQGYVAAQVIEVQDLTWNMKLLQLEFPESSCPPVKLGQHIRVRRQPSQGGNAIVRPFTPIVLPGRATDPNQVTLLVKIYEEGMLTSTLRNVAVGDHLDCSTASFGLPLSKDWLLEFDKLIFLAAGTGITPMLRPALLASNGGKLLFFNRHEKDCCLDSWLDLLQGCQWQHVLSQPSPEWEGLTGRLSQSLLETADAWDPNALYLVCGPHGFVQTAVSCLATMPNVHIFS
eukprot:m.58931 g.58931  ORF g.58931 m.58931 type:complete len:502 (+) comp13801_c0_seq6:72-1577(+)